MIHRLKKLNWQHLLAVLFVCIIFIIGLVTFPMTITETGNALQKKDQTFDMYRQKIDNFYNEMLATEEGSWIQDKATYINLNGAIANMMGQRMMNNSIKLNNGKLSFPPLNKTEDLSRDADAIIKLANYAKEKNIPFLYVQMPFSLEKDNSKLPIEVDDYTHESIDIFLSQLKQGEIDIFDFRQEIADEGINHDDLFFNTDHHWTTEASFWGYQKIYEQLLERNIIPAVDEKYTSLEYFHIDTYTDIFLGSFSRRTGRYYAGLDDISLIYPKFDTNITVSIPLRDIFREGSFYETIYHLKTLDGPLFKNDIHSVTFGSNFDIICTTNESAPIDMKVLILNDSMLRPTRAFLSLIFTEINSIYATDTNIKSYIDEFNPDLIIVGFYGKPSTIKIHTEKIINTDWSDSAES